jgi:sulfide dehydrogenase cytochrome subunit
MTNARRHWLAGLLGAALICGPAAMAASDEGYRLSQTCAGCHGTDGAAPGNTIPILGGQRADYLTAAMAAYRSGERDFYVMNFIARAFDEGQTAAIADWFAAKPWVDTPTASAPPAGDAARRAGEACAGCHGGGGEGSDKGPRIAGQPAAYMTLAMMAYKSGARSGTDAMEIVNTMDDGDIAALAAYYAALR